jgi:hypothetical protein
VNVSVATILTRVQHIVAVTARPHGKINSTGMIRNIMCYTVRNKRYKNLEHKLEEAAILSVR